MWLFQKTIRKQPFSDYYKQAGIGNGWNSDHSFAGGSEDHKLIGGHIRKKNHEVLEISDTSKNGS